MESFIYQRESDPGCDVCALEDVGEELFHLGEEDAEDETKRPKWYCEKCVKELFKMAIDREGDYPPLGYLELDHFARNRLFDDGFQDQYRARENMYEMFPRWTRIFCRACNYFVGQYRKQVNGKSRRKPCLSCKKPVCMGCGITNPDQDHRCQRPLTNEGFMSPGGSTLIGPIPSRDYQTCPNCRTNVQLTAGCNTMTCSACGTSFCYLCGVEAREGSDHWNSLRGVCSKYSHPTPLEQNYYLGNRNKTNLGRPVWQGDILHPHIDRSTGIWKDPVRRQEPAREFDGLFSAIRNDPAMINDRPIFHLPDQACTFQIALRNRESIWSSTVKEFERGLRFSKHIFRGPYTLLIDHTHAQFVHQVLSGAFTACALMHNGLDTDIVSRGREFLSVERILYAHEAALFRTCFAYMRQYHPKSVRVERNGQGLQSYMFFLDLQDPLDLAQETEVMTLDQRSDLWRTTYLASKRFADENPNVDGANAAGVSEVAQSLERVFKVLQQNPDALFDPAERTVVFRHIGRVERVREGGDADDAGAEAPAASAMALPAWARPLLEDKTMLDLDLRHSQTDLGHARREAQQAADYSWAVDILDTLAPAVAAIDDPDAASGLERACLEMFVVLNRMCNILQTVLDRGLLAVNNGEVNKVARVIRLVMSSTEPVSRIILSHALNIVRGMLGETEGIFTDIHADADADPDPDPDPDGDAGEESEDDE